jgi:hypothetical protein
MPYTHQDLLALADTYDGRSCGAEGASTDSITGQNEDGTTFTGSRMDQNGTFQDVNLCCIVQKCVFGQTPPSCASLDLLCPSRWGRINPRTCEKEVPKLDEDGQELDDDAHRQGYYRSKKECCYHKVLLDGCTPRSPDHKAKKWEKICCPYGEDDSSDNILSSGAKRGSEDYLID